MSHLLHYFIPKVPRENNQVIWLGLPYFIRMNFLEVVANSVEKVLDKTIPFIITALSDSLAGINLTKDELYMKIEEQIFSMINEINDYDPSSISCPTLIIGGRLDNFAPYQMSEELHKTIPNSTLKIIDMAGHFAPAQRKDVINKLICEFIRDINKLLPKRSVESHEIY